MKYPALIDGESGAYGVSFPDLPGVVAMGDTPDEAVRNAADALEDFAAESRADGVELVQPSAPSDVAIPRGCALTTVSLESAGVSRSRTGQGHPQPAGFPPSRE